MTWLWNRKREKVETANHAATIQIVNDARHQTAKSADEANDTIEKLNKLLIENGITLKIQIAAGGQHRDRH